MYVPQDHMLKTEYGKLWVLTDIMPLNGVGMTTARDHAVIGFEKNTPLEKATTFRNSTDSNEELCNKLSIPLKAGWDVSKARKLIKGENILSSLIQSVLYRPFDIRWIFYHDSLVWRTVKHVMRNMLVGNNIALITTRQTRDKWDIFSSRNIITHKALAAYDINSLFPLYLYPSGVAKSTLFDDTSECRKPNLAPKFIEDFAAKLRMEFIPDGKGDRKKTFGPEDIFNYIYAVFHSPTYRSRYAEFLKMDFPRLPLTSNPELFRKLCSSGDELVALHLMEKHGTKITSYPVAGDSAVETVRYTEPQREVRGRVWINATQYFDGAPKEVWEFHVGGYQVCAKWLKDRKGRKLTYDDLTHYQQIVSALAETIVLMENIDAAITASGGWPIA